MTEELVWEANSEEVRQVEDALSFEKEVVVLKPDQAYKVLASERGDMFMVPLEELKVMDDFNIRIRNDAYDAHIRSLADSMKECGFYQHKPLAAIATKEGKKVVAYITDGHCRMEAVRLANSEGAEIRELPVVLQDKATTREDLTVALIRSNEGKVLTPIEKAIACKRLSNWGWKNSEIASRVGVTTEYVSQLLTLAGAPQAVREMVQKGEATAATAVRALNQHGNDASKVLESALKDAQASGKKKVTAIFLPDQLRKKAFTKAAPSMFKVIEQVKGHDAFETLPGDLKKMIDEIIEGVSKAVPYDPEYELEPRQEAQTPKRLLKVA